MTKQKIYITIPKESRVKLQIEKVNKILQHIPTDNVTKLNELIYAGAKLVGNKLDIPIRNPSRKQKLERE